MQLMVDTPLNNCHFLYRIKLGSITMVLLQISTLPGVNTRVGDIRHTETWTLHKVMGRLMQQKLITAFLCSPGL